MSSQGVRRKSCKRSIVPPQAQPLLSPLAAPTTQKGLPKHGAPSRGFTQPQFPRWAVERKLILSVSPFFSLGCGARSRDSWASPLLGEMRIPVDVRGSRGTSR